MNRTYLKFLMIGIFGFVVACGGGSDPQGNPADPNPGPGVNNPTPEGVDHVSLAIEALKSHDVSGAQSHFDDAVLADATNSSASFGAAFCRLLFLGQTDPANAVLDGLGQKRFAIENAIGTDSFLEKMDNYESGSLATRPQADEFFPYSRDPARRLNFARLIGKALDDFTAADLQTNSLSLQDEIDSILVLLESAYGDTSFQFTLPKELYYSDTDVEINRADLGMMIAGLHFANAGISFANTWSFDIDLGSIYQENPNTPYGQRNHFYRESTQTELLDALNQFFQLRSTAQLAEAKSSLASGLAQFLDTVNLLSDSEFGILESSADTSDGWNDLAEMASALTDSLGGLETVPGTMPVAVIDLATLFSDPPDLDEIGIDPFVVEGGKIKMVESFFQQMIDKVLGGVDLDQDSFTVLASMNKAFTGSLFSEFRTFNVSGTEIGFGE